MTHFAKDVEYWQAQIKFWEGRIQWAKTNNLPRLVKLHTAGLRFAQATLRTYLKKEAREANKRQ